jgi:putative oxidoreductase
MNDREKLTDSILLVARIMLSLMFIESAVDKLMRWDFFVAEVGQMGIPFGGLSLVTATVVEILGSIMLLSGFGIRFGALALAAYTIIVSFFYFDFWNQADIAAIMARKEFLKNIAVAGGLLVFAVIERKEKHPYA